MGTIENYGRFIPQEKCFELLNEPPRKWMNLHTNKIGDDEFFGFTSNLGDGHSFVRDKEGNTVNLIGYDCKFIYIRDEKTGEVFSPWGVPAPNPVEDRSCRYYLGKTEIKGTFKGLTATQRIYCPLDYPVEFTTVTIENNTQEEKIIDVFQYAMFNLTGCDKESNWVDKENYTLIHPEIGGVIGYNRNTKCPTDRYKAYVCALNGFKAADGYRDQFLRSDFSVSTPKIMFGYNCQNKPSYGPDSAAAIQTEIVIPAGGTGRVDFVLGQTSGPEETKEFLKQFNSEVIDRLCDESMKFYEDMADKFEIDVGDVNHNSILNIFVKKQLYTYLINKSGFRDNMQVDYALSMADPDAAVDNFLRALSSQDTTGKVVHGFRPINWLQYSDKPAWILMTGPALLKETGDMSLLERKVGFLDSDETATVWEHMLLTMRYLANDTGVHGLCKQHHADWNDGLEATPETGERESVMVTEQLCYGLLEMIEIANIRGEDDVVKEAQDYYDMFKKNINEQAWDGEWYNRFLCEDGYKAGSHINEQGKMFINGNTWAVLSGIGIDGRAEKCMDSLEKMLGTPIGYKLVAPGFSKYDPRIGRMSNSMPGHVENGGCYNHAAGFKAVADCMLKRPEAAWDTWIKVAPDNPANPVEVSAHEPFVFTNFVSQIEMIYGRAGNPWVTGTAAWFTILMVEWILGARRTYQGLMIDPCLTKRVPKATIKRTFRGAIYNISLDNTASRCCGVTEITVDGKKIEGNILPVFDGGEHEVKVII